ncbi:MAG TPA: hypothetical protein DIC18_01280 [Clostridiales bacterium]|nr:hypothetical protein [Clostridiales bacterium]HCU55949.1 hypothetical protein [Clostridiales bacterium]
MVCCMEPIILRAKENVHNSTRGTGFKDCFSKMKMFHAWNYVRRDMILEEAVRYKLAATMKEKEFSPYRLCKEGGIPKATISQILSGKNGKIKLDTLYQILATMNVSLGEFFSDDCFSDLLD